MNLYFETYSGIAGNMTIASLLDLGADKEVLIKALESMEFGEYELEFDRVKKNGIDGLMFDVNLHHHKENNCKCGGNCKTHEGHHHHEHNHDEEEHHHHHEEGHKCKCHGEEHHHHEHRNIEDVFRIIESGDFSDKVKEDAKGIFSIIARAESKAHGVDVDKVHFHEVGAVDSIIDIVGTCVLIENLGVENIYFTDLYEGYGFVKCAHGNMPVPVPAVVNIVAEANLPLNIINDEGEHITPTGAAIVAYFSQGKPDFAFSIKRIGIGAGSREFKNTTNILRVMEIENTSKKKLYR